MKRLILLASLFGTLMFPALSWSPVFADPTSGPPTTTPQQAVCQGVGLTTTDGSCGDNGVQFGNVITAIVNLLSLVIGLIAVVMIIVAGFNFVTSGGDSGKVANARNSIIYALIGLVIVAMAELIVHFVLGKVQA